MRVFGIVYVFILYPAVLLNIILALLSIFVCAYSLEFLLCLCVFMYTYANLYFFVLWIRE